MIKDEINQLSKELNSVAKIEIPEFKLPSISKDGLFTTNEIYKIIFKNGSYFDRINDIIILDKGQTYKGEKKKEGKKFILLEGEYKWPSGQIFNGKFENNNKYKGQLLFTNGNKYDGNLNSKNFEGEGKFFWNDNEHIEGNFINGEIYGFSILQKKDYSIKGNFYDSKINGEIKEFNLNLNGHIYEFPKFNFRKRDFVEKKIHLKKDNKSFLLFNKQNVKKRNISSNKNKIIITDEELAALNECFKLINNIIPNIQLPSIPEEGLIVTQKKGKKLDFQNGAKANVDYDEDEHTYVLYEKTKEKEEEKKKEEFKGFLKNIEINKYCLDKGKYIWQSGQEYNGEFNDNNKFNSVDAELKYKDEWNFKGTFKNGKLEGNGKFEWKNGNKLDSYFSNGRIDRKTIIKWGNIFLEGNFKDDSISEFEANINDHLYKIQKIDKNNHEDILFIEKDETEYFSVIYEIKDNDIVIEKADLIENNEKESFLNILNSDLELPKFEPFWIGEEELIEEEDSKKEVNFEGGIIYNIETKTLLLPNKEIYKGELKKDAKSNKYFLDEGEYEWPSGQKYIGKFNEMNTFKEDENIKIIFKDEITYNGRLKNGKPFGKGDIKFDNGDYIIGNFENGKIFGETNIKKNNIVFKGNYVNSIIKGEIKDINITINKNNYKISNLTINKGAIEEDYLNIEDDNNNKVEIKLNDENKKILSPEIYKQFEFDENDLISMFKFLYNIRKINIPYNTSPSIPENVLFFPKNLNKQNVKMIFPNNETFKGSIKSNNEKDFLDEGEYEWPFGQKYKGKFKENKFDTENGELSYNKIWKYKGGFKLGIIEGYGEYQNEKGEIIKGNFEKGEMKDNLIFKTKDVYFEGKFIDSISDLYIKIFKGNINNYDYEIYDFKMSDEIIKFKRNYIPFSPKISQEMKLKMIESLLIKAKSYKRKFFYNEPFKKDESKENKIKMLKIQDNINSKKLSKLSIYCNRLSKENRYLKGKIGKIIGVNLSQQISYNELMHKIKASNQVSKDEAKNLYSKIEYFKKMEELSEDKNYNDIEEKEILKICNSKLLKDMENEIYLINQDINTLRKEREIIEKEKNDKNKELKDLNYYYNFIKQNCNEIMIQKAKIEDNSRIIEQNLKNVIEDNNYLVKYLNNINNNEEKISKNVISDKIKDLEIENNKILKEINEKQEIINNGNDEKKCLLKKIKELEDKIKKQNNL